MKHFHLPLLAMAALLSACQDTTTTPQDPNLTLGIGHYPGLPQENFAPQLSPDTTYRNIALLRMVKHSSCYGYDQTAQLVTDGIITTQMPKTVEVSTPDTIFSRREQEYTIDGNPYTNNAAIGEETYLQYKLSNWNIQPDEIVVTSMIGLDPSKTDNHYEISITGSDDGSSWQTLCEETGTKLPIVKPTEYLSKNHAGDPDPDNIEKTGLDRTFKLKADKPYNYLRLNLKMKGNVFWRIAQVDFKQHGEDIDLHGSDLFTSAWQSEGAKEEWVSVDLGSPSTFDKIRLNWVNKAKIGSIQTSDDETNWKEIAQIPATNDLTDEIAVNGKGRYVRLLLTESNGQPYVLSEVEVMGRGGLKAVPAAQPAITGNRLTLSGGNWKLQRSTQVNETGETLSSADFDDSSWLVATVPGTVLTSYMNLGAVPNSSFANNASYISESYFKSNFWYRNTFTIPEGFKKQHLQLNFDGINWKANIWLNGKQISRIEGAFKRGCIDVDSLLHTGENVLAVEIIRNAHFGGTKEKCMLNTDYNGGILGADNPTFHASIGWDWITSVRGRNMGIWNDVYVTTSGDVTLSDPVLYTKLNLPDTLATLTPEVVLTNHADKEVVGLLQGSVGSIQFEQNVTLKANETMTIQFAPDTYSQLKDQQLALWWPNGYGKPVLYDANFTFKPTEGGAESISYKAGIRQMTFDESDGILKIYVNGRRFIARGGNWGFSEHNLNYRGREYDAAVAYHADMNFTMIRNWVGMIGDEEFYDACDKYGIMIWQDFWLANPCDGPDPDDNKMFLDNAEDMVKRIRRHPSIGIYVGRNEGFPPAAIEAGLRQIIKAEHNDIHYIPSSADEVVSGHGPYWALTPKEYFCLENGVDRLHSERGMPNVMNYESLCRTLSTDALWPQNDQWGKHDYTQNGAQKGKTFNQLITDDFGFPDNAKDFTRLAQWINYEGYRAMFESRSIQRKGLLLWMSHPCWPSMVWQTYDYYFEPTAAYFGCKKANEPLHIQLNPVENKIEVVNYSAGNHPSLVATAQIYDMQGTLAWEKSVNVSSSEDTTEKCIALEIPAGISEVYYLKLQLKENDQLLSDNFYIQSKAEKGSLTALATLPKAKLKQHFDYELEGEDIKGVLKLENTGKTTALFIRINLKGADGEQILPVFYQDNYFSLLPGEQKSVTIRWKVRDARNQKPVVEVNTTL